MTNEDLLLYSIKNQRICVWFGGNFERLDQTFPAARKISDRGHNEDVCVHEGDGEKVLVGVKWEGK